MIKKRSSLKEQGGNSGLSEGQLDVIIKCFIRDDTITETYEILSSRPDIPNISRKTIGKKYKELRYALTVGALTYPNLFGGAGAIASLGQPSPEIDNKISNWTQSRDKELVRPRIQRYKCNENVVASDLFHRFKIERALRFYARYNLRLSELWTVAMLSIVKLQKLNNERHLRGLRSGGYIYLTEINWALGNKDLGLREDKLWEIAENFPVCRNHESYLERFHKHMKWILKRHPLGSKILTNTKFDTIPPRSKIEEIENKWFPDGFVKPVSKL